MNTVKNVTIFEHIARRQVFPDGLLGPSQRHMKKVQDEILDVKPGIYVEILDKNAIIEGVLNENFTLTFAKVIDTTCLYYAEIPETALNPHYNTAELTVSGPGYSQEEVYTFSAHPDYVKVVAEIMSQAEKENELIKWMKQHREVVLDIHTGTMERTKIAFQPHLIYKDRTTGHELVYGYRSGKTKPFTIDFVNFDRVDPEHKIFETFPDWRSDYAFRDLKAEHFYEEIYMIDSGN
ncbi:MAG: hypothetical protein JNJ75_14800 [Cyclobacteriaceae bacterium]|nr:hypothetical protein [Cyclobacteriaceae bacterium]